MSIRKYESESCNTAERSEDIRRMIEDAYEAPEIPASLRKRLDRIEVEWSRLHAGRNKARKLMAHAQSFMNLLKTSIKATFGY